MMEAQELPTSPRQALNAASAQTKDIVTAVEFLRKQQDEADRRVQKEKEAHGAAKQKIKQIEETHAQAKAVAEEEANSHLNTKEKLEKEERFHAKTREALRSAEEDVANMRMQMDAMKVEMEAQRKAFVINVNWAARCTELKTKYDQQSGDYDALFDQHVKAKSEHESTLRSSEEYKKKQQAYMDAYAQAQEEIARQAQEVAAKAAGSDEVQKKLEELDEFLAKKAEDAVKKKLGSQQALSVMQRSLAKGEEGVKMTAFQGWSTIAMSEKKKRIQKDRVMQRTLKTIATEGMAVVCEMFKEWQTEVDKVKRAALAAAQKRLEEASGGAGANSMTGRQRAIAQMQKQFQGEDKALMTSCFQGWALGQVARKKKEQNHKKASRMIANSGKAFCAEIFGLWNDITEKKRKKNREKAANMKKAGRFIANKDQFLCKDVFQSWWGWIQGVRRKRKVDEAGTAKAMRMIANSNETKKNLVFDSWMKIYKAKKGKDAGNKKALRMIADSAQAMIIGVFKAWSEDKKNAKAKEGNTAKAVRMINNSSEALQASVYQAWAADIRKNRDRNKKIRALEKSFGAQDKGRMMVVFTSWQSWAKVEGRHKKKKQWSMRSAIKSITGNQDLLKCHMFLAWGRYANIIKGEEKVAEQLKGKEGEVESAIAQARLGMEGDLVKAQADVVKAKEDLEAKKKDRDGAVVTVEKTQLRLDDVEWTLLSREREVQSITAELEQSRRKAKDIGQELGKVGDYISTHATRKTSRSGSGRDSRPGSGSKNGDDKLPRIDGNSSRPRSGSNAGKVDGSKSARGVPGERVDSGRRDGRPPRKPQDGMERRFLADGRGPFTLPEFLEIFAQHGQEVALQQWNAGAPEVPEASYDAGYGGY